MLEMVLGLVSFGEDEDACDVQGSKAYDEELEPCRSEDEVVEGEVKENQQKIAELEAKEAGFCLDGSRDFRC